MAFLNARTLFRLFLSVSIVFVFGFTYADEKKNQKSNKRENLDFSEEIIEGDASGPDLLPLMIRKKFNFKRLIRLRKDFLPEMRKTSEDLERKGS